jgi:glutathione synthase
VKIVFLVNSLRVLDENPALLGGAFLERGWSVRHGLLHTLSVQDGRICSVASEMLEPIEIEEPVPGPAVVQPVDDSDLVWVMNRPHPGLAWDIWQILWVLQQRCEFVNRMEALAFLNNKHVVHHFCPPGHCLESYAANDVETLLSTYRSEPRRTWIAKPANAAAGTDVYLLSPGDTNAKAILQSMTGNTLMQSYLVADLGLVGLQNRYALLQEYAAEVQNGEKRVVFAGGEVVTQHGRLAVPGEHRSNQVQGGRIYPVELTEEEAALSRQVAQGLLEHGIRFGAVDLAWPYVIEFNLMCPGGLKEIRKLTGVNWSGACVDLLVPACRLRAGGPAGA